MRLIPCRHDRESGCGQPVGRRLLDQGRLDPALLRQRDRFDENGLDSFKLRLLPRVEENPLGGNGCRNVTGADKRETDKPG